MTATMRALMVEELADGFAGCALRDRPIPQPGEGEALVRVHAASVNFPDLLMTRGAYQFKPPVPFVSGMEMAGEVLAVGAGVNPALVGTAVVGGHKTGAFADYALLSAASLRAKPATLDWAQAAGYSATYLTAWVTLTRRGMLQPGEWVLVHGASGGVGLACVDMAKALGARVIAAGGSTDKLAQVQRLYAPDALLVTGEGRFRDQVKALTDGRGADLIVDPVGGDMFDESTHCIAFDGRLLVVGFAGGRIPTIAANLPLIKGFSVVGVRAGEYGRRFPDRGAENLAAVDRMVSEGRVQPHVHAKLPLERWREAFGQLEQRAVVGKVVLTMGV